MYFAASACGRLWHYPAEPGCPHSRRVLEGKRTNHGRWSQNNGKNEIAAFTDIDESLSFGTVVTGKSWGRPNDKIGLAGAINGISNDHRDYLAVGVLGILIGDSRINYRHEKILETFYALAVMKDVLLSFDYQFMVNPAYNADRGPVSIFSGRLHAEF